MSTFHHSIKRSFIVISLVCLLVLVATTLVCGAKSGTETPIIRWSERLTSQSLLFLSGGFIEKYDLNYKGVNLNTGVEVRDALLSGAIDIGEVGVTPMLTGLARDPKHAYIIGASSFGGGKYAVVVRVDSPYQKMEELVSKKIAVKVGSGCYSAFFMWAKNNGYDPERDFQILDMGDVDAMAALEVGSVDAVVYWEPIPALLIAKGVAREIFNFKGLVQNPVFLLARRDFADKHPEAVAKFLAAWADVNQMITFNVGEAAQIISEEFAKRGTDIPVEALKLSLQKETFEIWLYPSLIREVQKSFAYLQEQNKVPAGIKLDWADIIRPDFVARAQEILIEKMEH